MNSVESILSDLIKSKSVTPHNDGAIEKIEKFLSNLGFATNILEFQGTEMPIKNLYARLGTQGKNLCFAGHTDVVPEGDGSWSFDPFAGEIKDGFVNGRGAVDMKGGIAAFLSAIELFLNEKPDPNFSISVLVSGNEEGDFQGGMPEILEWLKEKKEKIDFCMMAEPSSINKIGDAYKKGRRGSVNFILKAFGVQGHIAEQNQPDNVIFKLSALAVDLYNLELDKGNDDFQPSNLEFSTFDTGNMTENLIPENAEIRFNIRFSNAFKAKKLVEFIEKNVQELAKKHKLKDYNLSSRISGEVFLSKKAQQHQSLEASIKEVMGFTAKPDTLGGTSDLRFMGDFIPNFAEFGLKNDTMHKVDERTSVKDLEQVRDVFYSWLKKENSNA